MLDARAGHAPSTILWLRHVIRRYERDVALMTGVASPSPENLDDLAILDRYARTSNRRGLISDRKLRIKTLHAMIDLLQEPDEAAGLPSR